MKSVILGHHSKAASARVSSWNLNTNVTLDVTVKDEEIRKMGIAHDGYEKVFALVPSRKHQDKWERIELTHVGGGDNSDHYRFELNPWRDDNYRLEDLRQRGVAFGIEVSAGYGKDRTTLWLQKPGDDYKLA